MHHNLTLLRRTAQGQGQARQPGTQGVHSRLRRSRANSTTTLPGTDTEDSLNVDMGVPALSVNISAYDGEEAAHFPGDSEDAVSAGIAETYSYSAGDAKSTDSNDNDNDNDDDDGNEGDSEGADERSRLLGKSPQRGIHNQHALYGAASASPLGTAHHDLHSLGSAFVRPHVTHGPQGGLLSHGGGSRGNSRGPSPSPGILSHLAGGLRRIRRDSTASTGSTGSRSSSMSSRSRRLSGLAALPKPLHTDSRFVDIFTGLRERQKTQAHARASVSSQMLAHAQVKFHDYSQERIEVTDVDDVGKFSLDRPDWAVVRWIDIDGLDVAVMEVIGMYFRLHPLALDDCFQVPQQPKVDFYPKDDVVEHNHLFMITNMMFRDAEGVLCTEQVSIFMLDNILITVQEGLPGDVWSKVRLKLSNPLSKIRCYDVSYLLYALLDGIVAACYPEVESLGAQIDDIELELLSSKRLKFNVTTLVYQLKRDLLLVRRTMGPMRDVVVQMTSNDDHCISKTAITHLTDVKDSASHLVELMETYWECSTQLSFLYSDRQAHKMNAVLYRLTLISSVFLPLTFVAGVYGMNFDHMPELHWTYGYLFAWMIFVGLTIVAIATFLRMGLMELLPQ